MSIAGEITRINGAKLDMKSAIEEKEVSVPSSALISDYSLLVDSIETGGGTPDPYSFDYENWITYGDSEPDASSYHYWVNTSADEEQAPLKMVQKYTNYDSYQGSDITSLVENGTLSNDVFVTTSYKYSYKYNDDYVVYATPNKADNNAPVVILYVFKITGEKDPGNYASKKKNIYRTLTLSTIIPEGNRGPAGGYCLLGDKIYLFYEIGTVRVYDIETEQISSLTGSPLTSSMRIASVVPKKGDANKLWILTHGTSGNISQINTYLYNISSQSSSFHHQSVMPTSYYFTSMASMFVGENYVVYGFAGAQWSSAYPICLMDTTNANFINTAFNPPVYPTSNYAPFVVIGLGEVWFTAFSSGNGYSVIRVKDSNGSVEEVNSSNYGNLFMMAARNGVSAGLDVDISNGTFTTEFFYDKAVCIDGTANTYYFPVPGDYTSIKITDSMQKNCSWTHGNKPNFDSTNCILLPSVNGLVGSSAPSGYLKFYPQKDKKLYTFSSLDSNYATYGIYNGNTIQIKTSDGTNWNNSLSEDVYMFRGRY